MNNPALTRPSYIIEDYANSPEGIAAYDLGAKAVQMRRVLILGQGVLWQGRIRKGCECPFPKDSRLAEVWEYGFSRHKRDCEAEYNNP